MINWKELLEADADKRAEEYTTGKRAIRDCDDFIQGGSTDRERLVKALEVFKSIAAEPDVDATQGLLETRNAARDFLNWLQKELGV